MINLWIRFISSNLIEWNWNLNRLIFKSTLRLYFILDQGVDLKVNLIR